MRWLGVVLAFFAFVGPASAAVLERLGMRKEAHLIENEWVKGEWQSEAVYAILAREWREARGRR